MWPSSPNGSPQLLWNGLAVALTLAAMALAWWQAPADWRWPAVLVAWLVGHWGWGVTVHVMLRSGEVFARSSKDAL